MRILVANDNEWTARSLGSILEAEGYEVVRAYTGTQALTAVAQREPDAVILDAQLPDLSGFEVARRLRQEGGFNLARPIIIATAGPSGRAERMQAYEAGAWEFFGQPIDGEALVLRLRTWLAAKEFVDSLAAQALVDHDLGIYSRNGLEHRAREISSEMARRRQGFTCVALSSTFPLPATLRTARFTGRASDTFGRLDGESIGILAPATGPDGARVMAERFVRTVEALLSEHQSEPSSTVKCFAGYWTIGDASTDTSSPSDVLSYAAEALQALARASNGRRWMAFDELPSRIA